MQKYSQTVLKIDERSSKMCSMLEREMNQEETKKDDPICGNTNYCVSSTRKRDHDRDIFSDISLMYQKLLQIEEAVLKLHNDIDGLKRQKKSIPLRIISRLSYIAKQKNSLKWKVKNILKAIMQKDGKPRSKLFGLIINIGRKILFKSIPTVPKNNYISEDRVASALRMIIKKNNCRISHIIAVPFLKSGGADLVAINYAKVILQNQENSCMILITDTDSEMVTVTDWLPKNILIVSIANYIYNATWKEKSDIVYGVTQYYLPKTFHIINSSASWMMLIDRGKVISNLTKYYGSIFALQFDENGRIIGYASEYLKKALPYLEAVITDNNQFVIDAFREFALSIDKKNKFNVIYNPSRVMVQENNYPIAKHNYMKLLWAGRIDKEKYPDLINDIIKLDNNISVDMYGSSVVDSNITFKSTNRLHLMGPFSNISDIKGISEYDAFIFTSRWEGLPNILLEVGSLGVPIIAPNVGGVPELIDSNTGYLVCGARNIFGYLDSIMSIRQNPNEAKRRAKNLQNLIKNRHSWQKFTEHVMRIQNYV